MEQVIICVDDDKFLVDTLTEQIRGWVGKDVIVEKALSGSEALEILDEYINKEVAVPLVISDYIMPGMNGAEVLAEVFRRDKSIKTIMLTGYTAVEGIVSAINNASLYRFITKPWNSNDLMLTVQEALKIYEHEKKNRLLINSFEKLYRGYEAQLDYWTKVVARIIDSKSVEADGHSRLVAKLANELGHAAGLTADDLKALRTMAFFHDIGRLALSEDDLKIIIGKEALIYDFPNFIKAQSEAAHRIFNNNPNFDKLYLKGVGNFYEKFNGSGVNGLSGNGIPIEARIIGIANFYAVLANPQSRSALSPSSVLSMISSLSGSVFDPKLFALFSKINLEGLQNTV